MVNAALESNRRLQARSLAISFEGLRAIDNVDLEVSHGEILGLIGPNGAGKTTLVNVLSGFLRPQKGTVHLDLVDITTFSPQRRARLGLIRTFQTVRPFRNMTVLENIELGGVGLGLSRKAARERASRLLDAHGIGHLAPVAAGALAYGDERRVGVLRAVAAQPTYLLLDEPAAGLDEAESDDLAATIRKIRDDTGCGIILIEHDMRVVMALCDRVQVLDYGKSLAVGTPEAVQNDATVIRAYLGSKAARSGA